VYEWERDTLTRAAALRRQPSGNQSAHSSVLGINSGQLRL